jgi:hypothetical protein
MLKSVVIVASLAASSCSADDFITCATSADCVQGRIGGVCTPSLASETQWCAFPDPACPGSAERWGIESGDGLGGACLEASPPDAGVPDGGPASGTPAFDVVYVDEWKQSYDVPMAGALVIINKAATPLDFQTLHVKYIDDDQPTVAALATMTRPPGELALDEAAGALDASPKSVINPLLTEHIFDDMTDILKLNLAAAGNSAYDLKVDLVMQLDGIDVPLPITIHHVPGPATYGEPLHAIRVHAFR